MINKFEKKKPTSKSHIWLPIGNQLRDCDAGIRLGTKHGVHGTTVGAIMR